MVQHTLKSSYCDFDENDKNAIYNEIGVDEAGRGPMLGRVYASAVILPNSNDDFDHSLMKDSKKFHSEKKIKYAANYIKTHAIAWSVQFSDETIIDEINIRNATHNAMHSAISDIIQQIKIKNQNQPILNKNILLMIDGNDFTSFIDKETNEKISHICIEAGDNTYSSIAAASILSKVSRDEYIEELCNNNPFLDSQCGIVTNKGYGTKKHMEGIKQYGISPFHRKSFGICKLSKLSTNF